MTRKPTTGGEVIRTGPAPRPIRPSIRPAGDVEQAPAGNWIYLKEAVDYLTPHNTSARLALDGLWRRIVLGQVSITCDTLVYEEAQGSRKRLSIKRPGPSARLADQLLGASGLKMDVGNSDVQWVDLAGEHPVNALALGLLVDRDQITASVAKLAKSSAQAQSTRSPGRPDKTGRILQIFEQRVLAGETLQQRQHEVRAICAAWDRSDPPQADTVRDAIKSYYALCKWDDNILTNAAAIVKALRDKSG